MKRVFHATAVLTILLSLSSAPAFAEPYPSRLVRVMVPASAGGVTDLVARITADRTTAAVFDPVRPALHREGHVGGLRLDAELAEEPYEQRVRSLVVDEEAGVEHAPAEVDRVRMAAGAPIPLEELDVVDPGEQIARAEARDSRSDHRNPHRTRIRPPANIGCRT